MKRILLAFILITLVVLSACKGIETLDDLTNNTDTTEEITTQFQTTDHVTTTEETTNQVTTTEETTNQVTTIINDEIYLQLNAGIDTIEINSEWNDEGALFVINDDEYEMNTSDTVDIETLGLYDIEYSYLYEEVTYTIVRYVIVVDQTPPEIELNLGVDTIKVGEEWTDAGVIITDNSGEDITAVITGEVDNTTPGTYTITYTVTDSSGNESELIRFVTVIE